MSKNYFFGSTVDDLLRDVIIEIKDNGSFIKPSKGKCKELIGVVLELNNPRARLSRTEIKGTPFSCLGELCWYLAGSKQLDFIKYYIKEYEESADNDIIYGGYGPRLFNLTGINQIGQVIYQLKKKDSRKAVIQLFAAEDLSQPHNDVPCTCFLQFFKRDEKIHLITYMRSNDVYKGFPHDVFCFTMLQEIIARRLSLDMGFYKHIVGSIHLYESDDTHASQYIHEGYQPTTISMPSMPLGNPSHSISELLTAENEIRIGGQTNINFDNLDPYWADLVRLLSVFRLCKDKNKSKIDKKLIRTKI